jgi:hypothetical protein
MYISIHSVYSHVIYDYHRRYCTFFLRGIACTNPSCLYLHDLAKVQDCYTKEDLSSTDRFGVPLTQSYQFGLAHPAAGASRASSDSEDDSPSTSLQSSVSSVLPQALTRSTSQILSKSAPIVQPVLSRSTSAPAPPFSELLSPAVLTATAAPTTVASDSRQSISTGAPQALSMPEGRAEFLGLGMSLFDLRDPSFSVSLVAEAKWDFQRFVDELDGHRKSEPEQRKSRFIFASSQSHGTSLGASLFKSGRRQSARSRNNSERVQ